MTDTRDYGPGLIIPAGHTRSLEGGLPPFVIPPGTKAAGGLDVGGMEFIGEHYIGYSHAISAKRQADVLERIAAALERLAGSSKPAV